MALKAFGAGKVILLGEHAVVYGLPALAGAIHLGIHAQATAFSKPYLELPPNLTKPERALVQKAFLEATRRAGFPKLRIRLKSDLPVSMGLGSSAALSVAISRVLSQASAKKVSVETIAFDMEKVFHGKPSGVDQSTSLRESLIRFQKKKVQQVKASVPLSVLVALVGPRGSTRRIVQDFRDRMRLWPRRYRRVLSEIGTLVDEGISALEKGDLRALGDAMNLNHGLLAALQLSSSPVDDMVYRLRQLGALGAKLTGAGGQGGAVIGLFERPQEAVRKLQEQGVTCFVTAVGRAS